MFSAIELEVMICDTIRSHSIYPRTPANIFRRDGVTPFSAHQIMGAMLFLHEENLSEKERAIYAKVMLGHEFLEDTRAPLPSWVSDQEPEVKRTIREMTFDEGQDKFSLIWGRSDDAITCSFCDNGINFMVSGGRTPDRQALYRRELPKQAAYVEKIHPGLNMTIMFRALLSKH